MQNRDELNFPIVNFSISSSNIPPAPAYGVYVVQLVRYHRACCNYQDFVDRWKLLSNKLSQGIAMRSFCQQLKSSMEDIMTLLVPTMCHFLN